MTKISPRRSKGTLLAMLSFGAALASCLVATPATAQSVPSAQSVANKAALPVSASEFEAGTLASCPDHRGCVYGGANYTVFKIVVFASDAGVWGVFNVSFNSAKNTFDNRRLQIGHLRADGTIEVVRCLNPNTKRPGPFPDGSNSVRVGRLNSRC